MGHITEPRTHPVETAGEWCWFEIHFFIFNYLLRWCHSSSYRLSFRLKFCNFGLMVICKESQVKILKTSAIQVAIKHLVFINIYVTLKNVHLRHSMEFHSSSFHKLNIVYRYQTHVTFTILCSVPVAILLIYQKSL